jgi:hypothetical protein
MTGNATERASISSAAGPELFFQAGKTEMAVIGVCNGSAAARISQSGPGCASWLSLMVPSAFLTAITASSVATKFSFSNSSLRRPCSACCSLGNATTRRYSCGPSESLQKNHYPQFRDASELPVPMVRSSYARKNRLLDLRQQILQDRCSLDFRRQT